MNRLVAIPGLGKAWAKFANVSYTDLARGAPRAIRGLLAAFMKKQTPFAQILTQGWQHLSDPDIPLPQRFVDAAASDPLPECAQAAGLMYGPTGARDAQRGR